MVPDTYFPFQCLIICVACGVIGCPQFRDDLEYEHSVEYSWNEPQVTQSFSLFEGVAWDPAISHSVTSLIRSQSLVANQRVLDLFSGPGVVAVLVASESPKQVVSLAEDEISEACTKYNVAAHEQDSIVKVQRLDPWAEQALPPTERFDVILASLSKQASTAITPDIRIKLLLQSVDSNLELSGRAFVICEPGDMTDRLRAACESEMKELIDATKEPTIWKVFEIKSMAKSTTNLCYHGNAGRPNRVRN